MLVFLWCYGKVNKVHINVVLYPFVCFVATVFCMQCTLLCASAVCISATLSLTCYEIIVHV